MVYGYAHLSDTSPPYRVLRPIRKDAVTLEMEHSQVSRYSILQY